MKLLSIKEFLLEAFNTSQLDTVGVLISKYLTKKLKTKVAKFPGLELFSNSFIKDGKGLRFFYNKKMSVRFNFIGSKIDTNKLHSIDIWNGTTSHPNFNLKFPHSVSIVKILPSIIPVLLNPHEGEIELYQAQDKQPLNESETLEEEFEELILESKLESYNSHFDELMTTLEPGKQFTVNILPNKDHIHYNLYKYIVKNYSELFEQASNKQFLKDTGGKTTIIKNKDTIIEGTGGFFGKVVKGAQAEKYDVEGVEDEDRVTFKEQLGHLKDLVKLILKGASNSLIISGKGGVGKTQSVEDVLSTAGLEDGEGYFKNSGSVSAIGLYTLLYKYRDDILLFDDSDSVWGDQEARNILKAATDTKKTRKIAWNKRSSGMKDSPDDIDEGDDESIPKYFFYTGKIIFISNLDINKLDPDGAMRTRSLILNVNPTDAEMLDYMKDIINEFKLEDGLVLNEKERLEVFEVVKESKNKNALSLRRLVRALNIRAGCEEGLDWKRLVQLYA